MLFIGNIDGTLSSVTPSVVTQGSNLVQSIDFVSPALSKYTAVNISFILANGTNFNGGVLIPSATTTINGVQINAFHYPLDTNVTNYNGSVKVGFECYVGDELLVTYTGQFEVTKAIPVELTEEPTSDVYEQLLVAFGYLSGRINTGELEASGVLPYNENFSYSKNAVVIFVEDYNAKFYTSLVDNNLGNLLTDEASWKKINIV